MKHLSKDDITRDKKPINCKSGKLEKVKTVEMYTEVENSEKLQQKKPKIYIFKTVPTSRIFKITQKWKIETVGTSPKRKQFRKTKYI